MKQPKPTKASRGSWALKSKLGAKPVTKFNRVKNSATADNGLKQREQRHHPEVERGVRNRPEMPYQTW
jgi:hypothetical protein